MSRCEQPADPELKAPVGFPALRGAGRPAGAPVKGGLAAMGRIRTALLATGALLALAACEPGTGPFTSSPGGSAATASASNTAKPKRSTTIVERDVEAPQVFQVTEEALWDGRPSLGGVWVASPNVTDPERVIMRNQANGKFVIGALFRREADNPGPKLQISSDAADALGLLAGQPAKLSVTALRREETQQTAPGQPVLDSNESLAVAKAPVTTGPLDGGGVTSSALPAAGATAAAAPVQAGTKKTKSQLKREAEEAAKQADARLAAAEATAAAGAGTTAGAVAAQPAAQAAPPAPAPAATKGRSIQIGFFSQEANATRAQGQLAKAGVTAQIRKESSQGKDYWSVFTKGDSATLKKIKSAGFADAYMLK
ncbi:SPOR domain-containing protein [Pseudomonas sp. GX19020]|uniref:SPOR domain-containing protein n=1 Tax=Pseudomonas sp. GX19020 TaxID=2942277 RepID=UPI0020193E37|nr:SPOR domain-containing protein [Pseudomonas sp. GX19020]MCL4065190.1 SPOR domain-containing protein [Pseudomonas sp. GX19020]